MILNLNSQIIWVFVDLLILFVLMKKFLFGPITRMLDDRAQQVSDTLDQADKRLAEAEQQQTAHAAQLASAKQEAAKVSQQTLNSNTDRAMIDDFLREETEAAR